MKKHFFFSFHGNVSHIYIAVQTVKIILVYLLQWVSVISIKVDLGIAYIHNSNISFKHETVWDGKLCAG